MKIDALELGTIENRLQEDISQQVLRMYPMVKKSDLQVVFANIALLGANIPKQAKTFKIALDPKRNLLGKTVTKVNFYDHNGHFIRHYSVLSEVKAFSNFVYVTRDIRKGSLFVKDDLVSVHEQITHRTKNAINDVGVLIGKEALHTIYSGSRVLGWMVKKKPVVFNGQDVKVFYSKKRVIIGLKGRALEDGEVGDKIRVQLLKTKRIKVGEVRGKGEVNISSD